MFENISNTTLGGHFRLLERGYYISNRRLIWIHNVKRIGDEASFRAIILDPKVSDGKFGDLLELMAEREIDVIEGGVQLISSKYYHYIIIDNMSKIPNKKVEAIEEYWAEGIEERQQETEVEESEVVKPDKSRLKKLVAALIIGGLILIISIILALTIFVQPPPTPTLTITPTVTSTFITTPTVTPTFTPTETASSTPMPPTNIP